MFNQYSASVQLVFCQCSAGIPPVFLENRSSTGLDPGRVTSNATSNAKRAVLSRVFRGSWSCHGVFKTSRVGSESVQNLRGWVGSGQERFKSRGSGQVGSKGFLISRFGSGPVKEKKKLTGQVTSTQEAMKSLRIGSDHDPRETGHSRVGPAWPASCFLLTRGSDPRIRLADPTLKPFPLSYPKTIMVPILNNTPLVSCSNVKTPPNPYTHVRIHPFPLQPGHTSLRGTKNIVDLFLKCRPTGRIRGSRQMVSRVKVTRPA